MTETQGLNIAVVGATGAVGRQMIATFENRNLPIKTLSFYHQRVLLEQNFHLKARKSLFKKQNLKVLKASILLYSVQAVAYLRNLLLRLLNVERL